ncbi:hypothetical protein [Ralstonia soli]|uniref:Uncharacterized protein n=1 Tax=Ralstonia soli TaxID=2953896 RepID=A0ABT1AJG7_9RALS|nr:hypothetical protein [Ralstonia soli]MCO5398572.1 hypothetical protein [Ralstonia soli]
MTQSRLPPSHAIAVYFCGGIQYCFDCAPRDFPTMDDVAHALEQIVWRHDGHYDVPIHARRDGFLIFDFDKSTHFAYAPGGIRPRDSNAATPSQTHGVITTTPTLRIAEFGDPNAEQKDSRAEKIDSSTELKNPTAEQKPLRAELGNPLTEQKNPRAKL